MSRCSAPAEMRASTGQPVSAASDKVLNLGSIAAAAIDHGKRQSLGGAVAPAPRSGSGSSSGGSSGSNANKLRPLLPNVPERVGKRAPSPLAQQPKKKRTTVQAACQSTSAPSTCLYPLSPPSFSLLPVPFPLCSGHGAGPRRSFVISHSRQATDDSTRTNPELLRFSDMPCQLGPWSWRLIRKDAH